VLLDEAFSALDFPARNELRHDLRRLQRETGLSTVLVTHDPEEAALLADEILIVVDRRIVQAGPRREVFERPASPQAARLLGATNVFVGVVCAEGRAGTAGVPVTAATGGARPGTRVEWCIPAEESWSARTASSRPRSSTRSTSERRPRSCSGSGRASSSTHEHARAPATNSTMYMSAAGRDDHDLGGERLVAAKRAGG
jgi:ABC-type Fe3+/spermidine/putrescine transport system ATPase subunit